MPLKVGEIDHRIVDYDFKIDYPDGRELKTGGNYENEVDHKRFDGFKAGLSGNATLFRTEAKLSDRWEASIGTSGPSIGGSLGVKMGEETGLAAIVEPSLVKLDGKVGQLCGTVGLNGTTGVQINEEGFKFGLLGFGVTYGIGRRYSIDTPLISGGFSSGKDGAAEKVSQGVNTQVDI